MFYKTIILSKVEIYLLYSTLKNKTGEIQSTEKHKWSFVMKRKKKVLTKQNIICCMDSKRSKTCCKVEIRLQYIISPLKTKREQKKTNFYLTEKTMEVAEKV